MKDFKDLGDAVQSFGGKNLPSSEEIMALTSLQTTSIGSNDVEAKLFLKKVRECLGPDLYQVFLDLMVQIRQGYRTDQPAIVVEKYDLIKGILTRENPELRLQLDRFFPIIEAMKRKVALEQYSIQQSTIQYQKWKIHYQSKMLTQEHSRRTRYAHFGSEKLFLPLKVPNHFAPNRESKKRRLSPTLQFQSIITQNEDFEQHPDSTLEALQVPSIFSRSPDPTELLRQMTTQLLPRARIPGARTKIDS